MPLALAINQEEEQVFQPHVELVGLRLAGRLPVPHPAAPCPTRSVPFAPPPPPLNDAWDGKWQSGRVAAGETREGPPLRPELALHLFRAQVATPRIQGHPPFPGRGSGPVDLRALRRLAAMRSGLAVPAIVFGEDIRFDLYPVQSTMLAAS